MNVCFSRILTIAIFLWFPALSLKARPDLGTSRLYLETFLQYQKADELEKNGFYLESLCRFKWAGTSLERLRQKDQNWEVELMAQKIKDCHDQVVKLEPLAVAQVLASCKSTLSLGPPVSLLFDEGTRLENGKLYYEALVQFDEYRLFLEIIHRRDPKWETEEIEKRIQDSQVKIDRLRGLALK